MAISTFRQINTDHINNYPARDNGAHQYIWVVHSTVLSLALVVVSPNSPLSTTGLINRFNGMKHPQIYSKINRLPQKK